MKEYQKRVVEERMALAEKVKGLESFIKNSDEFKYLRASNATLLQYQLSCMKEYLSILETRIEIFSRES